MLAEPLMKDMRVIICEIRKPFIHPYTEFGVFNFDSGSFVSRGLIQQVLFFVKILQRINRCIVK